MPSNFDQRHLFTAQVQYTTGVGVAGGGLLDGVKGTLFKGWTVTAQLNTGSGLPLTPVYPDVSSGHRRDWARCARDCTGASTDAARRLLHESGGVHVPGAVTGATPAATRYAARSSSR